LVLLAALAGLLLSIPPQWYPRPVKLQLAAWFGPPAHRPNPPHAETPAEPVEAFCPEDLPDWRGAYVIEGVEIQPSPLCRVDNPWLVAAAVRGTNNVAPEVLMRSGLTADAVTKGADLDGDGDPDEIHIRLEVAELNGPSPETAERVAQYALAPGIEPGFWVFAPKFAGMSTESFESLRARDGLRLPSPAIRVEQGDRVFITLENSHYMPHTIHLHGTDHAFQLASGQGNDGVPIASEMPVMPGQSRTYELQPRTAGTKFYHCHVQPHVHVMMGLQGLFVIEENRPDNWVQTLNVGAGQVRAPSRAVREAYDREYDLHYTDVDIELNQRIQQANDVRRVTQSMHRDYNVTEASSDYFALNGVSFPYTFRESLVVVQPDEKIKLRVVNGGRDGIALHTHGHTMTITHRDGIESPPAARITRDVAWLATAQRLDIDLSTTNDGLGAYGPGVWLFHDHGSKAVTSDGIGPGGHISAIVYEAYLGANGWPQTRGVSWDPFFTPAYYQRRVPVWERYAPGVFSAAGPDRVLEIRLVLMAMFMAAGLAALYRHLFHA
jgi:FtsP/CotA-like multicopper oxidase with cupredoxin domain